MTDLTPLSKLDDIDVLQDIKTRVKQMKNSDAGGYDAAIEFYSRIIERIEEADDVAVEGWARMRAASEAANDGEEDSFELATRLRYDTDYLDKRLKALGEDEEVVYEPVNVGDQFIYTHNGSHVYVASISTGRWHYAELRFVDGDEMFNSACLIQELQKNEYGFWEKVQ